jgi:Ca2+-binding EF-hand superfamily protein
LDGSNTIDVVELERAFQIMGQGISRQKLQSIVDQVDEDGRGEITWAGYLKVMRILYPSLRAEYEKTYYGPAKDFPEFSKEEIDVFVSTFRKFDVDGSESIDVDELSSMFLHLGQGCSRDKLQRIIDEVDDNGNGVVDWPEFLQIMRILYPDRKGSKGSSSKAPIKSQPPKTQTQTQPPKTQTQTQPQSQTKSPQVVKNQTQPQNELRTEPASSPKVSNQNAAPSSTGGNKCASCSKTVYPVETINALNTVWHKGCFKCQEDGCGITLNLKTFKGSNGKIFCSKHVPAYKATSIVNI